MLSFKVWSKHPRLSDAALLVDWSLSAQAISIETTQRGYGTCTAFIPLAPTVARYWFGMLDGKHLSITDKGRAIYEGRCEVPEATAEGLSITAYGYSRAYSDIVLTDLWSSTRYDEWSVLQTAQQSTHMPEQYAFDTNNRLYIAPNSGDPSATGIKGGLYYSIAAGASRLITAVTFTYTLIAPTGWIAYLFTRSSTFAAIATPWSLAGNGTTQSATVTLTGLSAADVLNFSLFRDQAAATLNAALVAGTRTVTPSSMTGIKKGTKLSVSGIDPEDVDVTAVTATTFTATFKYDHASTDTAVPIFEGETGDIYLSITGLRIKTTSSTVVYSDEIVKAINATVAATNPNQAHTATIRIKSPGFDLLNFGYADKAEAVLDQLADLGGDNYLWSWRVWNDQILIFDRITNGGQTFQVYTAPPISRDLGSLTTRLIPRYTDESGVDRVATTVINAAAEAKYGIVRTDYFDAPTTSATDAVNLATYALTERGIINVYGDITTDRVYQNGAPVPLWAVRSGDMIQCIRYPTSGNADTDKTRVFRVAVTRYDHATRTLTISPEQRTPSIDNLLARREIVR